MNEYELDLLRQRSAEARRAKGQTGELIVPAPVGFMKTEEPPLEKDPDCRVQQAIAMVLENWLELGSAVKFYSQSPGRSRSVQPG